jgi:hypothetical protein
MTDFVSGTDQLNYAAVATGNAVNTTVGAAATYAFAADGVGIINTTLDVTAATTSANVAAALNAVTGFGGGFTGTAGDIAFFAIIDTNGAGAADDQYNIFQVTLGATNGAAAALDTTDTVSLVTTLTAAALVAGDFILV